MKQIQHIASAFVLLAGFAINANADDLNKVMKTIPSREKKVLRMRYGFDGNPLIYEEIGKMIGVSKQRARDIEAKALRRLRNPERSKHLVDYVIE